VEQRDVKSAGGEKCERWEVATWKSEEMEEQRDGRSEAM
jgi:hypothetical protein